MVLKVNRVPQDLKVTRVLKEPQVHRVPQVLKALKVHKE